MEKSLKIDNNSKQLKISIISGASALIAHIISGILYPLELLKIKLQANEEKKKKVIDISKEIYNKSGIRGFFRGFYFNILVGSISNMLFFLNLDYLKIKYGNIKGVNYSIAKEAWLSFMAGVTASYLTLPIWTLRTRVTLAHANKQQNTKENIRLTLLVVKESIKTEGILGLYKGIFSTTVLASYGMIQMTLYNSIKYKIEEKREFKKYMASLTGIFSRILASVVLYPFNLVRTRQQLFDPQISASIKDDLKSNITITKVRYGIFIKSIKHIFHTEGYVGFYKGLGLLIFRQIPYSALFFYTYENSKEILTNRIN